MCLTIDKIFSTEEEAEAARLPSIAEDDIVVWKYLSYDEYSRLVSPYKNFAYKFGKLYKKRWWQRNNFTFTTEYILHMEGWALGVHRGFHAYTKPCRGRYKAVVPKGAKYFVGQEGREIVSSQLIVYNEQYE